MSDEVMGFLKDPHLLELVVQEYHRFHAGDAKLLKFLYIVMAARYVVPIWCNISGSSRGGKDNAVRTVIEPFIVTGDAIVALRFTEHGLEYAGIPGQPLVLDGKIIYVSEEKGIVPALDTLRPIYGQKGRIGTIYSVGINRKGQKIEVKGCPTLITTAISPNFDPQTLKRLWLLSVDESQEATRRAHRLQKYKESHPSEYLEKSREMLLIEEVLKAYPKNVEVFIPYAEYIEFPYDKVRTRGDLQKFLDFVKCVTCTFMFQRQRVRKDERTIVISTTFDFEMSRDILSDVFVASLTDVPNAVQQFYQNIRPVLEAVGERMGDGEIFCPGGLSVKDIVRNTGLADPSVRRYMDILVNAGKISKSYEGREVRYFPTRSNISNQTISELVYVDWERCSADIDRRLDEELNRLRRYALVSPDGEERDVR